MSRISGFRYCSGVFCTLTLMLVSCADMPDRAGTTVQPVDAIEAQDDLPLFIKHSADCSYPPAEIYSTHRDGSGTVFSPDGRWHIVTRWEQSIHEFDLYDLENNQHYLIYHPNVEVGLSDFNFSLESEILTFIGGPWDSRHSPGLSEIFSLNLETFLFDRFGDPRSVYEHPVSVLNGDGLLFYELPAHLGSKQFSFRRLASQSALSRLLGYRNKDGEVTYLLYDKYGDASFGVLPDNIDFRDTPNQFEKN